MGNKNLIKAAKEKDDEFYTQLSDIEKELRYYKEHFKDKVVFCNCDDPYESNFFKYFALNFNYLKLKKLIATCFETSPIAYTQIDLLNKPKTDKKKAYQIIIEEVEDINKDGAVDLLDVRELIKNKNNVLKILKGNGDFRSNEALKLLEEADIVVTNPPFSLFREYISLLMKYEKNFLIMANQNAITYKEIFPLLKENKVWLGNNKGAMWFEVPLEGYGDRATNVKIINGKKYIKNQGICWFTNLDFEKRHEKLVLYKKFDAEEFLEYDNYNAINIDKIANIPGDYYEAMGVPITIMHDYNPDQFEILDANNYRKYDWVPNKKHGLIKDKDAGVKGDIKYVRVLIKRKKDKKDED